MSIFNHFQQINLTKDQHSALEKLQIFLENEDRVFILQGYAGTGKTTLLKGFGEYLQSLDRKYQLMAPTGRAAKVINQKTGLESTTIHKGMYSFDWLLEINPSDEDTDISYMYQFNLRSNPEVHNSVLIIDEASMIGDVCNHGEFFRFGSGNLLQDIFTYARIYDVSTSSKIIFIGDPAQLPPIGMNFSPALDLQYLNERFDVSSSLAELKEVKRQDENNSILLSALKIRQCLTSGYFNDFDLRENNTYIFNTTYQDYLETYKAQQEQKIIICYKNKTALDLNRIIRKDKFGEDLPIQVSDTVIIGGNNYRLGIMNGEEDLPIQVSDTVIIGGNNYRLGIMNGEFAVVSEASTSVESREISFYLKGGKTQNVILTWRKISLIIPDENNMPKTVSGFILENYLYGDNILKPEEQRALYVDFKKRHPLLKKGSVEFGVAMMNDKYLNCILLKYGYAVTCHKAQGGEWANTFVFWDKGIQDNFNFYESEHNRSGKSNSEFYRWAYTAVTRASKRLFCINPPYFSSFSGIDFIDTNVQQAFNDLTGQSSSSTEVDFNDVLPELEKFGLIDAPLTIQDHFINRWYHLRKHYIDIEGWQKVEYEIRYIFKREGQTAAFKYWINGQNVFKNNFQKLPSQTNSNELFEVITKILDGATPLTINRNSVEGILSQIQFDVTIEEEKPFLKNLFEVIRKELSQEETITKVEHLEYRERYTIEKNGKSCTFDFEYDKAGFFGRVLPILKKCECPELLGKIKSIVNTLKESNNVI